MVRKGIPSGFKEKNGVVCMNAKEFWHESTTQESYKKLQEMSKELDLTVIGGWGVWLWTKQHKSKDIDIIVDFGELGRIKEKYTLEKNEHLRKYEIKMPDFDVDIYVPFYSRLELPVEDMIKERVKIEGINTISCEALLILKQGAEINRRGTIKGQKDIIDILTILIYAPVNFKKYFNLLEKYNKKSLAKELTTEITQFSPKDSEKYLGIKFTEFAKWKKSTLKIIMKS